MLGADELLSRVAGVLRHDVGPAVDDEFAKTQAFMASVILEKVAADVRTAAPRARADRADALQLGADLTLLLTPEDPAALRVAVAALQDGDAPVGRSLHALVEQLYAGRRVVGDDRFDALLSRTRATLRARLDRQLEVAR